MSTIKTTPNSNNVTDFLAQLDEQQRADSQVLIKIMQDVSGEPPVMWGTSIIGFDQQRYRYASGREGDWMKIGFSPRKGKLSVYITGDASKYSTQLTAMGKHKIGKGCIYIKCLADVDVQKLADIIKAAYSAKDYF